MSHGTDLSIVYYELSLKYEFVYIMALNYTIINRTKYSRPTYRLHWFPVMLV